MRPGPFPRWGRLHSLLDSAATARAERARASVRYEDRFDRLEVRLERAERGRDLNNRYYARRERRPRLGARPARVRPLRRGRPLRQLRTRLGRATSPSRVIRQLLAEITGVDPSRPRSGSARRRLRRG